MAKLNVTVEVVILSISPGSVVVLASTTFPPINSSEPVIGALRLLSSDPSSTFTSSSYGSSLGNVTVVYTVSEAPKHPLYETFWFWSVVIAVVGAVVVALIVVGVIIWRKRSRASIDKPADDNNQEGTVVGAAGLSTAVREFSAGNLSFQDEDAERGTTSRVGVVFSSVRGSARVSPVHIGQDALESMPTARPSSGRLSRGRISPSPYQGQQEKRDRSSFPGAGSLPNTSEENEGRASKTPKAAWIPEDA